MKLCPWCKSQPEIIKVPLWHGTHGYHGAYGFSVGCNYDGCKVHPRTCVHDTIEDTEEQARQKAIDDWEVRL